MQYANNLDYKNLTWVWSADRKFCPEVHWHHDWCKTVIPRDGTFYLHRTLMIDSFSCIPFDFEWFILKVAFITTYNDNDVGTTKLHNVLYNHCKPNSRENFLFGGWRYQEWEEFLSQAKTSISLSGMQESIIPILHIHVSKISRFQLASVAEQAGLSLTC